MNILWIGSKTDPSGLIDSLRAVEHDVTIISPAESREDESDSTIFDSLNRQQVSTVVSNFVESTQALDLVVYAVALDMAITAPAEPPDDEAQIESMNTLIYGGFNCTQVVARHLVAAQYGSLVYLVADPMVDGRMGFDGLSAGSTSLLALSSALAGSMFRKKINVNSLIVGMPFDAKSMGGEQNPDAPARLAYSTSDNQLLMRENAFRDHVNETGIGWQETIRAMLEHLASADGKLITGSTFRVPNVGNAPPLIRWSY